MKNENYQVLARKYRPKNFAEFVGQTHSVKTLMNALNRQFLHHAFLFTGTRGVGKTTIARILAKCLNCEKGISDTPCDACNSCLEIAQGQSMDLIEFDAASRTKVDDMREILENAQYLPSKSRYKIYLIDEVHMLSKSSFNALLKTLEEPPSHIKFLLATTDPQKLPITVLSRCLQFNLQKISQTDIEKQLAHILNTEKIDFDKAALKHIANYGEGSMRDALSILDQAIAYSSGQVKIDEITAMLGLVKRGDVVTLAKYLLQDEGKKTLEISKKLINSGNNLRHILIDLAELLHRLAIIKFAGELETDKELSTLASNITQAELQLYYQITIDGQKQLDFAPNEQIGFEMVLLRILAFNAEIRNDTPLKNNTKIEKKDEKKNGKK